MRPYNDFQTAKAGRAPTWLTLFALSLVLLSSRAHADHASVNVGVGKAAPINTESGETLSRGTWSTGIRTEYLDFDEFSDDRLAELGENDDEADLHSVGSLLKVSAGLFYGVTDDLTVGLRIPYVRRTDIREPEHGHDDGDADHPAGPIEELGDADGIGDMAIFGQYRFFERPDVHHLAALVGLRTPTGTTNEKADEGFRLETELQPGSGSWDPILGLAYTFSLSPYVIDSNILYTFVTEGAQNTDLGDIFDYNLSFSYRLDSRLESRHDHSNQAAPARDACACHDEKSLDARPHGHAHHNGDHAQAKPAERLSRPTLDIVLELNGEWRDELEIDDVANRNSGGNVLYLSPGLRIGLPLALSIGTSVGVPVVTDLNGDQVEPNYRIITTLGCAI